MFASRIKKEKIMHHNFKYKFATIQRNKYTSITNLLYIFYVIMIKNISYEKLKKNSIKN
jgi:hypothetical protein